VRRAPTRRPPPGRRGDSDGLAQIYAARFLLLRHTGEISEADYEVLRTALLRLAETLSLKAITEVVVPISMRSSWTSGDDRVT
jgi:hypothetical protein